MTSLKLDIDWPDLIKRRNVWVAHNFPNQHAPIDSIMGVIEEVGEFTHAFLKKKQNIRGNEDHDANMRDALGDATIYLLGVMWYYDCVPQVQPMPLRTPEFHVCDMSAATGHIVELFQLNGNPYLGVSMMVEALWAMARVMGWDYRDIVVETWEQVEERDWIKYPNTGRAPVSELRVMLKEYPPLPDPIVMNGLKLQPYDPKNKRHLDALGLTWVDGSNMKPPDQTMPTSGNPSTGKGLHGQDITGG